MTTPTNPSPDIAHLGHVEMLTDRYDASLDFFTRVYGLKLSGEDDTSAYLRAWDDYEFCTLKLTRHTTTGVGHVAYRAASPEGLERRVRAIEASGFKRHGWVDGMGGPTGSRIPSGTSSSSIGTRSATRPMPTTPRR